MPSDTKSLLALYDIRDCITKAKEFTKGYDFDRFIEDQKTYHATTRLLEIISEASKRLLPEMKDRHPAIPWKQIRDAGNFYRHEYDNVAERSVWDTVTDDLNPLLDAILAEITRAEAQA